MFLYNHKCPQASEDDHAFLLDLGTLPVTEIGMNSCERFDVNPGGWCRRVSRANCLALLCDRAVVPREVSLARGSVGGRPSTEEVHARGARVGNGACVSHCDGWAGWLVEVLSCLVGELGGKAHIFYGHREEVVKHPVPCGRVRPSYLRI